VRAKSETGKRRQAEGVTIWLYLREVTGMDSVEKKNIGGAIITEILPDRAAIIPTNADVLAICEELERKSAIAGNT
jgi:hypothetical protein